MSHPPPGGGPPSPNSSNWSQEAAVAFRAATDQYVVDLTEGCQVLMRRQDMDTVSRSHVDTYAAVLASRSGTKLAKSLNAVGGIILGAGLGIIGSVASAEDPTWTTASVLLSLVGCTGGGILLAVGLLRE